MTNEQRRNALNKARAEALRHATWAEELCGDPNADTTLWTAHRNMASMWADVANALKDGDPDHDASDGASAFERPEGVTLTR